MNHENALPLELGFRGAIAAYARRLKWLVLVLGIAAACFSVVSLGVWAAQTHPVLVVVPSVLSILFIVVGLILAALLLCLVKDAFESGLIPVAAAMAAVSSLFVGRLASRIVLIPYLLEFLMRWIAKNHDEAEKKKNAK